MKYQLKIHSLESVLGLLSELLQLRVTFFDINEQEMADKCSLPRTDFCSTNRLRDKKFDQRCIDCDRIHIAEAKKKKMPVIYQCHAGLLEGVVPLYNSHGQYLGSIAAGQIDEKKRKSGSRLGAMEELDKIIRLIQIICPDIIQQEMIHLSRPHWVDDAERYIEENWNKKPLLATLCKSVGKPYSQMAHAFSIEFGQSFRSYIKEYRLKRAKSLLEQGCSIKETAFQCGFFDEFHFSRSFKAVFGYPPSKMVK